MKLNIGKIYIVSTINDYLVNKTVRVVGWLSRESASKYSNFIQNIGINEKFIDIENIENYYDKTVFFDCIVLSEGFQSTDEHIILWEDIIDSDRTKQLFETYEFDLKIKFKNTMLMGTLSKTDLIDYVTSQIKSRFGESSIDVSMAEKVYLSKYETTEDELEVVKKTLIEVVNSINAITKLRNSAEKISDTLDKAEIMEKINSLGENLKLINQTSEQILSNLK